MELNWDHSQNQTNNFASLFTVTSSSTLRPTTEAINMMRSETQALKEGGMTEDGRMGRMLLATYVPDGSSTVTWPTANQFYIWKYYGTDVQDISGGARPYQDANFILYRVSEIMMMKAQALTMKGEGSWAEAVELINKIRRRAALPSWDVAVNELDELTLLEEILDQKEMEFMAEGKRWYDLLWFGRIAGNKYKKLFISKVVQGNQTTNQQWILSVLQDTNAWYMPLPQADIEHNKLLEQNPYYTSTK
jgi:hypothetical protein